MTAAAYPAPGADEGLTGCGDAELLRRLHNARHYAASTASYAAAERWIAALADLTAEAVRRGLVRAPEPADDDVADEWI